VGRYHLVKLLGRGGMGEVYAGYDPELDRRLAIKILRTDLRNPDTHRARFMREAQAVARLDHPNVVGIHDVGNAGGRIFLAMELVEGETLASWLAARPRTVPEILGAFAQAGRGLEAAHQAGIVHRDFKPQNVMLGRDGTARVMDFGLAASAEPAPDQPRLTVAGSLLGTPHYMSPEQLLGNRADPRADQFSFCVALWEALHGALPFPGHTWMDLRAAVLEGQPRPGPLARRVPRQVQAALLRGLSVNREQRFASMGALLAAIASRPPLPWRPALAAVLGLVVLAGVVGGVTVARRRYRRAAACDPAPRLAGIWDDGVRAAARDAFAAAAAEVPDAPARFDRVRAILDDEAGRWGTAWRQSCEAPAAGGDEERVGDRALACLDRHRRELGALSRVLAQADGKVARRAMAGLAALSPLEACRDPAVLHAAPLADEATRDRLAPLTDRLLLLRAQATAGHDAQALEPARELLREARGARDGALLAEALLVTARIESPFDPDAAVPLYEEGFRAADAAGLPRLSGEAAVQLTAIRGAVQHRFVDADRWLGLAEVALSHTRGPDELRLRGWFLNTRGVLHAAQGAWRQARVDFAAAVAAREHAAGLVHPELGVSLTHLSRAAGMLDDAPAALTAAGRALDLLTGLFPPDSYEVAAARLARARALLLAGRTPEAAGDLDAASAAFERTLGHDHPFLAGPMTLRGLVELGRGQAEPARDLLERAWETRSTALADAGEREETAFALARAIWATSGDHAHALELAREARDGYAALPDLSARLTSVERWLAAHPDR
ncbi:MAG TPA: serine/threonine-protein kinase, partial [Polyangia bacterium]|nr:serine/threonine-protein kinase [Polyangia bacterium]